MVLLQFYENRVISEDRTELATNSVVTLTFLPNRVKREELRLFHAIPVGEGPWGPS